MIVEKGGKMAEVIRKQTSRWPEEFLVGVFVSRLTGAKPSRGFMGHGRISERRGKRK